MLREVKTYDLSSKTCFLVIDHDGTSYMGCLFIDDKVFRSQVADVMKRCIGMQIKDIGDLDTAHTL